MSWNVETMQAQAALYDYCHRPYAPRASVAGKLRASNLLFLSFELAGVPDCFHGFVAALRERFGINEIVWGVKLIGDKLGWEFYFYNDGHERAPITITDFADCARPFFQCRAVPNENIPYFMFSVDIVPEYFETHVLPGVHLYVYGKCASHGPRALSYYLSDEGVRLENHYAFYKTDREMRRLVGKIKHSVVVDFTAINLNQILLPELIDCYTICNANKHHTDCVYNSRIDMKQLAFFFARFGYPPGFLTYLQEHASELDHLRACVGFDYCMDSDLRFVVPKSGFYGTF